MVYKASVTNTSDIVYIAIGATLISVCSWISIPITVPFTLQTFAVFFVLLTLGGRRGTLTTLVYVLMGSVGIPVFAGFKGGIGVLLGNTGGYILGFIFMGLIYTFITSIMGDKPVTSIIALIIGLIVCYSFGTAWFMFVYMRETGSVGLMTVLSWCVFPFIIPDLLKLSLAVAVSGRVRSVLP
jgi:biotin transport system substrate-specific component